MVNATPLVAVKCPLCQRPLERWEQVTDGQWAGMWVPAARQPAGSIRRAMAVTTTDAKDRKRGLVLRGRHETNTFTCHGRPHGRRCPFYRPVLRLRLFAALDAVHRARGRQLVLDDASLDVRPADWRWPSEWVEVVD